MGICDLCTESVDNDAKRYSAAQMRIAVKNGLRPEGAVVELGANLVPRTVFFEQWVSQVMRDSTDWAVCSSCAARVARYLEKEQSAGTIHKRKFYGKTEAEAKTAAQNAGIAPNKIIAIEVTRRAGTHSAEANGADAEKAIESAKAMLPSDAFDLHSQTIRSAQSGSVEFQAQSENVARQKWKEHIPADVPQANLDRLTCQVMPQSGFLGLGRKSGTWQALWSVPFRARIEYSVPVEVTLQYRD